MELRIASVILVLLLPGFRVEGFFDYEDIGEQHSEDDDVNYDVVDEDHVTSSGVVNYNGVINNRIRRDQDEEAINTKTLSPEDLVEVKGALEKMLPGIASEYPLTPYPTAASITYLLTTALKTSSTTPPYFVPETYSQTEESTQSSNITEDDTLSSIFKEVQKENKFRARGLPTRSSKAQFIFDKSYLGVTPKDSSKKKLSRTGYENPFTPYPIAPSIDYLPTATELKTSSTTPSYSVPETSSQTEEFTQSTDIMEEDTLTSIFTIVDDENYFARGLPTRSSKAQFMLKSNLDNLSSIKALVDERNSLRNDTTQKVGNAPQIDGAKLLEIISELAKEFEANLTRQLNDTILQMSIPTCSTPTTAEHTTVTSEYDANYTGAVIAKCFVCGLDTRGIPQNAHCADAFAGDFLPLVPVDSSAKRKITGYRKYCKYANIRGYQLKRSRPRDIIGRWTGGCAVRWVDLSGVYTQRTCRNRMAPTTGLHFASKRMAKLERALWNVENGCIASPAASLTPLSRGVSLYARFHACVCSGSWCNAARVNAPYYWALGNAVGAVVVRRYLQ